MKNELKEEILDLALSTCRDISNNKERGEVVCDISEIFLDVGKKEKTKILLNRVLNCAEKTSSGASKAIVLCRVSNIFTKMGNEQKASTILDNALERVEHVSFSVDQKAEALADIVGVMIKVGKEDDALGLAENISNNYGRSTALARIADHKAEKGEREKAGELLEKTTELAGRIVFSLERRARAQAEIAGAMARNSDERTALDIAKDISFGEQKKKALKIIANASVKEFEHDRAEAVLDRSLTIAKTIQTGHAKVVAYNEIARAMIENGDKEGIDKIIDDSMKIAERISLPLSYKRVESLSEISKTLMKKDEKERAEKLLDRALKISKSISKDVKRAKALIKVANVKGKYIFDGLTERV